TGPLGRALVPCTPRLADVSVPDPDYVLTLDADSVLLPEYCARILYLLEQSGHAKVGVAQTPYSSYPGSATRIERIAGATTDLQHIVHQGMTHYDATFWVGANAILRKVALDEIVKVEYEGNWEIRRYIQDRTVIEDTESTIDLGIHGWTLLNYPERLAYSATPPDFGSLCIQRQRWANGGLLILSKLREQSRARRERGDKNRFGEVFLRVNYMASIFWASLCLLILLIYPFNSGLLTPLLPLIALPYFLMMASDLHYCGYKRLDVLRIYGFNLILLPVNLSGSFASLLQLITGEKSAFKRTPKVRNRTAAGAEFILAPLLLIGFAGYAVVHDVRFHHWQHLFFSALNTGLALYAMVAFVGIRNGMVDLWVQLRGWLYRPTTPKVAPARRNGRNVGGAVGTSTQTTSTSNADWESMLNYSGPSSADSQSSSGSTDNSSRASTESDPGSEPARRLHAAPDSATFNDYTFFTVFQPIVDLLTGEPVGYEALTRFADGRTPQVNLAAANAAGVGIELDSAMARAALIAADALPPGNWLSINVTPGLAKQAEQLAEILAEAPCPVVVDIGDTSESATLIDGPLKQLAGLAIAVDDAGANYESLARIDKLRPAFMRLHRDAVTGIEDDSARQIFVATLVNFADQHDCKIIAEGVESQAERDALRDAGVHLGQGYFVGRPLPIDRMPQPSASRARPSAAKATAVTPGIA
ncbi:MAG: EAL domain-containing protein, partial [Ilumatobacteraceae bacterium]